MHMSGHSGYRALLKRSCGHETGNRTMRQCRTHHILLRWQEDSMLCRALYRALSSGGMSRREQAAFCRRTRQGKAGRACTQAKGQRVFSAMNAGPGKGMQRSFSRYSLITKAGGLSRKQTHRQHCQRFQGPAAYAPLLHPVHPRSWPAEASTKPRSFCRSP